MNKIDYFHNFSLEVSKKYHLESFSDKIFCVLSYHYALTVQITAKAQPRLEEGRRQSPHSGAAESTYSLRLS